MGQPLTRLDRGASDREVDARIDVAIAKRERALAAEVESSRAMVVEEGNREAVLTSADMRSGAIAGRDGSGSWFLDVAAGGPDENPELSGRAKYPILREMRYDPAIRSLEWMFKLPLRGAVWSLDPPADDPDGEGMAAIRADCCATQLGLDGNLGWLDLTWDEWLQQSLLFMAYGAMGEEIVWGDPLEWIDRNGDAHTVRPFARFAPRHAATVEDIEWNPRTGLITRIRQDWPDADWIPGSKLCWYVMEREGSNWFGTSLFRSAWYPWKLKKGLGISAAIGWDRFASGTPHITHPPGADNQRKAEAIGLHLRVHERGWVTTADDPDNPQWKIDILEGQRSLLDPVPLLRHYDQQIAMAGLQQFSSLGTSERGSRAVGDVLADPFYLAIQAIADYVRLSRMKQAIRVFYDVNFGTDIPVPELKVSKIQGRNVAVLARALADLTAAGFTFTDADTQNNVREQLDLSRLPDPAPIEELPDEVGIAPIENMPPPAEGGPIA